MGTTIFPYYNLILNNKRESLMNFVYDIVKYKIYYLKYKTEIYGINKYSNVG